MDLYLEFHNINDLDKVFPEKSRKKRTGFYFFANSRKMLYLGRSKNLYSTIYQHINGQAQPTYQDDIFKLFTRFAIYEVEDYNPLLLEEQKKLLLHLFRPAINMHFAKKL